MFLRSPAPQRALGALVTAAVALVACGASAPALALDLDKRFTVGFRLGNYLPADEQKGGFRVFPAGAGASFGEHDVSISEVPVPTFSLGYGVRKLGKRVQLSLELEASRFTSTVGDETGYRDENASTRVALPNPFNPTSRQTRSDGDESFVRMPLGDLTMTPVLVHALLHWTRPGGRADFYCGAGVGVIMAELEESDEYVDFASDRDGSPDVVVDDAFATSFKVGSNVSLSRNSGWMLYFEAQFITTSLFSSESQVSWSGVDYFAGTQDVDTTGDNVPDEFGLNSDLRLMDSGHIRMDGAIAGIGVKYRFGGRKAAASSESAQP